MVVAFESDATNLVSGDGNGARDVFVHDRTTGQTERASVDSSGVEGNAQSVAAAISGDGRFVAFQSSATNLVAGDTNGWPDVFVHDRVTGTTERVSVDSSGVQGNSDSHGPALSADGNLVAFWSYATNLVAGDTNLASDVFVHDRAAGTTERVSVDSAGVEGFAGSRSPSLSADGLLVAFDSSAKNLVSGDNNATDDVFVHDRTSGATERAGVDSTGVEGNKSSTLPSLSADGQSVAFQSYASNLVAGDANGRPDIFVHDRATGFTDRMSVDTSSGDGNGDSLYKSISSDGRVVAFSSLASDLVSGDTNAAWDVFARDRCATDASWTNYGAGFAGTLGVPSFTSRSDPVLGSTLTLDLGNSSGVATAGLLFIGFTRTSLHSSWGGDLLVVPALTLALGVPQAGLAFTGSLPHDYRLCGLAVDLQAIELDGGAAHGVSFTPGLELVLGH
jgi:cold shock CspA family protein